MGYLSKHKEGLVTTIVFHIILIFIFISVSLFQPIPILEDKGILVDFGMTDAGMGLNEPTPKESAPPKPSNGNEHINQPVSSAKPSPSKSQPEEEERIVTQDYENTAIIESKKKIEDQKRKEWQEKQLLDKRQRDSLQKITNERIAEQNRIAQIRRQDSLKGVAEQASINQINSRAKNAFGVSGKGTDETSTGEGNTYTPGNQGSPDGSPGVKKYGKGGGGGGVSYNLSGRSALSLTKPTYPGNNEGIVVVEVNVDKFGNVTKAVVGVKGSTSLDANLMEAARKAAISTRFNQNLDAPAFQTGTITYHFVLN